MTSGNKTNANRENAKKSTGPRTPEGKSRVSQNSTTHGLRSRHAVMFMEIDHEYKDLSQAFHEEWSPATLTEQDLVEQLVVNKWKLARYEAAETQACTQSTLVHLALKSLKDYKRTPRGTVKPVDIVCKREAQAELSITRISQMIARVERSYFRALQFLLRLQDRRLKRQTRQPEPTQAAVIAAQQAPKVRTAGASAATPVIPIAARPATVQRR